jgi:undecaprenyl-diphosphatase
MSEALKWLRNHCDLKNPQCRSLLVSLVVVAVGIWIFVDLIGVIGEEQPLYLDRQLLLLFRESGNPEEPLGPHWLERAMVDITALGDFTILSLITTTIVGYFILRRQYASAAWIVLTIVGGTLLSLFFKDVFGRLRPDIVTPLTSVSTASFPSGHATVAAATYLTLGVLAARDQPYRSLRIYLMTVAVLTVLLVGITRIYLGVHWPSDVAAGWALGAVWAVITLQFNLRWEERRFPFSAPNA